MIDYHSILRFVKEVKMEDKMKGNSDLSVTG